MTRRNVVGVHKRTEEQSIIEAIKERLAPTLQYWDGETILGIGDYGAALEMKNGMVVGCAMDGVGTKLMIALLSSQHEERFLEVIGEDAVAMNANDLAVNGITENLLFLNYIATHQIESELINALMRGIERGCHKARMAAIGGETAGMADLYARGHFDIAGASIGFADTRNSLVIGKENIRTGMRVFGHASSGVHSNGFRTIRRVFEISMRADPPAGLTEDDALTRSLVTLRQRCNELGGATLADELMKPTMVYVDVVRNLCAWHFVAGMAHITGGGLVENPPRILPDGCAMRIDTSAWEMPRIFKYIQKTGGLSDEEMRTEFNCGIGLIAVSNEDLSHGSDFFEIGKIVPTNEKPHVIFV